MQGLDPASRRNLWEVVKKSRAGRGIVLTTHSMEEVRLFPEVMLQHTRTSWKGCGALPALCRLSCRTPFGFGSLALCY